jgi:hypothetical protein
LFFVRRFIEGSTVILRSRNRTKIESIDQEALPQTEINP